MSGQRATPAAGSARAIPSPSASPARPSSIQRSLGTPPKEPGRGAPSVNSSIAMGRPCALAKAAAAPAEAEVTPEMIAQLQERLQNLEAEMKASQDTAQWTIKQNKNILMALKQENKDLSTEVSRRGGSAELQGRHGSATDGERVVERLERQVHEMRRAYDKVIKDKKTAVQRLDNLHDSLKDLAKVAAAVPSAAAAAASASSMPISASLSSAPSVSAIAAAAASSIPANSPAARELRQLQNRLEKATVKANEAFSIRKTYEQVLEKLRLEEPLMEARIRALEEQKAMKQAALQNAVITGREAQTAKEAAKAALAALEETVAANRSRRARVLTEMRDKAATLQQTNRALLQRQFVPLTPPSLEASDNSAAGGAGTGSEKHPIKEGSRAELEDITARDLVVRLCRTTGAVRVSELVARLMAQQESYANLMEMRSQATAQRLALLQEVEVLRKHRDDLFGGGKMSTQKQMDAAQEELQDALAKADASSVELDAMLRNHADVRGGLEHLATMVSPLPLPPGGQPAVPMEDESMGDVLAQIEQRLVGSYKVIAALPKAVEMLESMYASLRQ
ncbi:hypothetical protein Vretimale_12860 [Volvox reticuliferus]|uniref:Uncharacterized protein n=1 Tax=Volvox reticuliferus TaxID=1737510 RepID=A0A8J4CC62_9CHLO|nr:hypothetical protein Vretifemale_9233 [Volvox reticuliferus]GIM08957.1 hypothetical protein Vretimale_12860 [Volvox reticuliferus]